MSEPLVLIVEDDADRVMLTRRALEEASVDPAVEVAEDGEEAIERLSQGRAPDLVLLDLELPGTDGFGVLEHVAEDEATPGIPIVVLTSSVEAADMERSYDLGANGFVSKPVDFQEFREVVQRIARFWLEINTSPTRGNPL
jgi:two-component system response regulator